METLTLTRADVEYVRANYHSVDELCAGRRETPVQIRALIDQGRLPRPSYVLPDGTEMFPADYFALYDDAGGVERMRDEFERRYGGETLAEDWEGYLSGVYAVCLRDVTPETVTRKGALVETLEGLLAEPRPEDPHWRTTLRDAVDELDALERDFSPDYDRRAFGKPPTRDTFIGAPRRRYPEIWAGAPSS